MPPYSLPSVIDRVELFLTVIAEPASIFEVYLDPLLKNVRILGAGDHVQTLNIPWVIDS